MFFTLFPGEIEASTDKPDSGMDSKKQYTFVLSILVLCHADDGLLVSVRLKNFLKTNFAVPSRLLVYNCSQILQTCIKF